MKKEIKEKLNEIANGRVPVGYSKFRYGIIPTDWEILTVKEVADITRLAGAEYSDLWETVEDGEILALRGYNIKKNRLDLTVIERISQELSIRLSRSKLSVGDIVYPCVGTIGNACVIRENNKFHINQNIAKLTPKKCIDSDFVAYYLMSEIAYKEIIRYNTSSTQPNVLVGNLRKFQIPIPKEGNDEMKRISDILSTWDKAIELKEKLIEEKKKQKKGLMQKLLTCEVRLSGFEDDWISIRLGDYLIKHSEKTDSNNQYPVLTSSRTGIYLQKDYFNGNDVASKDNTGYNVVPKGYFTYRHMSDDLVFKFNINTIVTKGIVSTLYPVFTTKSNLDSQFLKLVLNEGDEFKRYALSQKQGGSRTYMYYSKLEKLEIKIPSFDEQLEISKLEMTAQKEIDLHNEELELLKQQKKGLMQLLLTGIVRVNTERT